MKYFDDFSVRSPKLVFHTGIWDVVNGYLWGKQEAGPQTMSIDPSGFWGKDVVVMCRGMVVSGGWLDMTARYDPPSWTDYEFAFSPADKCFWLLERVNGCGYHAMNQSRYPSPLIGNAAGKWIPMCLVLDGSELLAMGADQAIYMKARKVLGEGRVGFTKIGAEVRIDDLLAATKDEVLAGLPLYSRGYGSHKVCKLTYKEHALGTYRFEPLTEQVHEPSNAYLLRYTPWSSEELAIGHDLDSYTNFAAFFQFTMLPVGSKELDFYFHHHGESFGLVSILWGSAAIRDRTAAGDVTRATLTYTLRPLNSCYITCVNNHVRLSVNDGFCEANISPDLPSGWFSLGAFQSEVIVKGLLIIPLP